MLKLWTEIEGVKAVSTCQVLDERLPGWSKDFTSGAYERHCEVVAAYCKEHDAYYYARDNEYFNIYTAKRLALEAGKKIVVVDNLS